MREKPSNTARLLKAMFDLIVAASKVDDTRGTVECRWQGKKELVEVGKTVVATMRDVYNNVVTVHTTYDIRLYTMLVNLTFAASSINACKGDPIGNMSAQAELRAKVIDARNFLINENHGHPFKNDGYWGD